MDAHLQDKILNNAGVIPALKIFTNLHTSWQQFFMATV